MTKEASELRVTGLLWGESTGDLDRYMADADNIASMPAPCCPVIDT